MKLVAAYPDNWERGGLGGYVNFGNQSLEATWIEGACKYIMGQHPSARIGVISRVASRSKNAKLAVERAGVPLIDWGVNTFSRTVAGMLRRVCDELECIQSRNARDAIMLFSELSKEAGDNVKDELDDARVWLVEQLIKSKASYSDIRSSIKTRSNPNSFCRESGVHFLTGHAGKGQEFDWVFVLGLEEGCIPHRFAKTAEQVSEEARILSVMISRAKMGCVLTRSELDSWGNPLGDSQFQSLVCKAPDLVIGEEEVQRWFYAVNWSSFRGE